MSPVPAEAVRNIKNVVVNLKYKDNEFVTLPVTQISWILKETYKKYGQKEKI